MENDTSKLKLFVGSSNRNNEFATDLAFAFDKLKCYEVVHWKNAFPVSGWTLESLITWSEEVDFGIFVFSNDDFVLPHGDTKGGLTGGENDLKSGHYVPRPNVIFELGLFMGKLGRSKVSFVVPQSRETFELPSDLAGITYPRYNANASNVHQEMQKVAREIDNTIRNTPRTPTNAKLAATLSKVEESLTALTALAQTGSVGHYPLFFEPHICRVIGNAKEVWIACDFLA